MVDRGWKRQNEEPYKEGTFQTDIGVEESPDGKEWIHIKSSKKYSEKYTKIHTGIWISKGVNVQAWLNWLVDKIKKLTSSKWGMEVNLEDNAEYWKRQAEELTKNLAVVQQKKEEAEQKEKLKDTELKLAIKVVDNLSGYESAFNTFKLEVEKQKAQNIRDEKEIKRQLLDNRWMLGLDCVVLAKEKPIDTQTSIDLHIQTNLGQDKIFEFKGPTINPFVREKKDSRLKMSDEFSQGINQLIQYLQKTDYRSTQKEEGGYPIQKAIGTLIIGFKLDDEQSKWLREWDYHVRPNIDIKTYDDLINSAENQLKNIRFAREESKKFLKGK